MLERIHPEVPDNWYESTSPESKALGFDDDLFYGHFTRDREYVRSPQHLFERTG